MEKQIRNNQKAHNRLAEKYHDRHPEIYNELEQNRLHESLIQASVLIKTESAEKIALDFGCGDGNLTNHLLSLNFTVVAADVAVKFLRLVNKLFGPTPKLKTFVLNGQNLAGLNDNSFDLIALYSVLHHLPDYLEILPELWRVTKKGGIIYLDHEVNENYWQRPTLLTEFYEQAGRNRKKSILKRLSPNNLFNKFRRLLDPKFEPEGDIHVFPDDHIEWDKIKAILTGLGGEVVLENDYLLTSKNDQRGAFEKFQDKVADMKVLIIRK